MKIYQNTQYITVSIHDNVENKQQVRLRSQQKFIYGGKKYFVVGIDGSVLSVVLPTQKNILEQLCTNAYKKVSIIQSMQTVTMTSLYKNDEPCKEEGDV